MCFPGGGQQILIPPNDRARQLADYLKACLGLIAGVAVCEFLGGSFLPGVVDVLAVFLGYMAVRSSEGYSYQQLFCTFLLSSVLTAFSAMSFVFYFTGTRGGTFNADWPLWMFYFFIASMIAAPVVFGLTTYFAYHLQKEMKVIVNEMIDEMGGGGGGDGMGAPIFGGGGGYDMEAPRAPVIDRLPPASSSRFSSQFSASPPAAAPPAVHDHPVISSAPSSAAGSAGWTPFTGQGHKLGDD